MWWIGRGGIEWGLVFLLLLLLLLLLLGGMRRVKWERIEKGGTPNKGGYKERGRARMGKRTQYGIDDKGSD